MIRSNNAAYKRFCKIFVVSVFVLFSYSTALLANTANYSEILAQAHKMRSANPPQSQALLQQIPVAKLNEKQKDEYDFLQAYSKYINGDIRGSIKGFEKLSLTGSHSSERFRAKASLVNLYGGTQNWSAGFRELDTLLGDINAIESRDTLEQVHLAVINFYNAIGESTLIIDYASPLLMEDYGLRFFCTASLQWLNARIETELHQLSSGVFDSTITKCKTLNEPIITYALLQEHANFHLKNGDVATALSILETHINEVEELVYTPIITAYYDLMSQCFLQLGDLDKAQSFAEILLDDKHFAIASTANVSAYNTLFQVAEQKQEYAKALQYFKQYAEARKLNIDTQNAKMLSVQKAKRDSSEKANQIALLDKENALLRAESLLDKEAAQSRLLLLLIVLSVLLFSSVWLYKKRRNYVEFRENSRKDGLTDIANRHFFTQEANDIIAFCHTGNKPLSFIMFDLDNFKQINDNHGHKMGDIALQLAVNATQRGCYREALLGRLGGEEFGIILQNCSLDEALALAEACRAEIEGSTKDNSEYPFSLTASFGVAHTSINAYTLDALFDAADSALYESKANGKNCVTVANSSTVSFKHIN